MLVDEVKIRVEAGKGGDGAMAFDKVKMSLGPTGGRGGNGGNIYLRGGRDIFALKKYLRKKEYFAENGKNGRTNRSDGPAGKDLFLTVPLGTIARNLSSEKFFEITKEEEIFLIASGGQGGRGNFSFRSGQNTSPKNFEKGREGEKFDFQFELRLIADIGIIGLPNAGKSTLLNFLTATKAKTGNYHFTTLEPNLGEMNGLILADLPGLISGASQGRGLGLKFLRHIKRTKVLVHCVSLESKNTLADYEIVRQELEKYSPDLRKKPEMILLTKNDLASKKSREKATTDFKDKNFTFFSVKDPQGKKKFKQKVAELLS